MSNSLNTLINSGFDAFSNLYKADVTFGGSVDTTSEGIELRIKDIKIPNLTLGEYKNHYKTVDITRLNAQFTGEREFSCRVRIDSNWSVYTALKNWKKTYFKISDDTVNFGSYSNNTPPLYGTVKIYGFLQPSSALTDAISGSITSPCWTFDQVVLYDIIEPQFQRATSAPVEVECKFMFGHYIADSVVSPQL